MGAQYKKTKYDINIIKHRGRKSETTVVFGGFFAIEGKLLLV